LRDAKVVKSQRLVLSSLYEAEPAHFYHYKVVYSFDAPLSSYFFYFCYSCRYPNSQKRKKRGAAGASHAQSIPFRGNGRMPDWMARGVGATHAPMATSGGSTTMRGLLGGIMAERLGLGKMVGDYDRLITHAERRCSHPYFIPPPASFRNSASQASSGGSQYTRTARRNRA
jgi:hypothetical protein